MPQQPNIVATKTVTGDINIFDYHKHPRIPENDEIRPQLVLKGHDKEGYGISWNPTKQGLLLSGADDNNIYIWDIENAPMDGSSLESTICLKEHDSVVEDVCWHRLNENLFGSVSDDKRLKIWDMKNTSRSIYTVDAHTEEILALDFSPFNENLLVTSSVDKTAALWDMRSLKECVHVFRSHKDEVNCVKFSPHHEALFATGSGDRRIIIWDITRIQDQLSEEELKDGPAEMLFLHGGHTAKVSDLDWNKNEKLMLASVAEDNIIQIWHMAREIFYDEKDVDMEVDQNE